MGNAPQDGSKTSVKTTWTPMHWGWRVRTRSPVLPGRQVCPEIPAHRFSAWFRPELSVRGEPMPVLRSHHSCSWAHTRALLSSRHGPVMAVMMGPSAPSAGVLPVVPFGVTTTLCEWCLRACRSAATTSTGRPGVEPAYGLFQLPAPGLPISRMPRLLRRTDAGPDIRPDGMKAVLTAQRQQFGRQPPDVYEAAPRRSLRRPGRGREGPRTAGRPVVATARE